jgi:hypothetical protein
MTHIDIDLPLIIQFMVNSNSEKRTPFSRARNKKKFMFYSETIICTRIKLSDKKNILLQIIVEFFLKTLNNS